MANEIAKILTDQQQRKSLSGPKSEKKRSVRNVLAQPYSGFWPIVDSTVEEEFQELLQVLLPAACKMVTADDRILLRKMQGKKMKEARQKLRLQIWERNPQAKQLREKLVIGVNDVSRALEENTIASFLISNEADPPILTRHLATLGATKNVPCIVLENLKEYSKKGLDFSALAIGFKKVVADKEDEHFHPIHLKILSALTAVVGKAPSLNITDISSSNVSEVSKPKGNEQNFRSPHEIHLVRSCKSSRVFIPGQSIRETSDTSWTPYIAISSAINGKTPALRKPTEILGTRSVSNARLFLQTVNIPKKDVLKTLSSTEGSDSFLSLSSGSIDLQESNVEVNSKVKTPPKHVKRYFNALVPLKVKRIQSNPMKIKKRQKQKK